MARLLKTTILSASLCSLLLAVSCASPDAPNAVRTPHNNGTNNATNNGTNNGANNGANNGPTNNGTNNGTNTGTNNGTINNGIVAGGLGDPCDVGDECRSGWCIDNTEDGTKICTDFCAANTCPDGYVCAPVANSGSDRVFLCFPETQFLCDPCAEDAECGGRSDRCVSYASGTFCGRNCEQESCPDGYDCVDIEVDGETTSQCRSSNGSCCRPTNGGVEACDGIDNDCDGETDEDFKDSNGLFTVSTSNCGACGRACNIPFAEATCASGDCDILRCADNQHNVNIRLDDGCEYACTFAGAETCNDADDDCDGLVDEDFLDANGVYSTLEHCGACGEPCTVDAGTPLCAEGVCGNAGCAQFFGDCDSDPTDCETSVRFDPNNCGACSYSCAEDWAGADHAITGCQDSACTIVACQDPWRNCNNFAEDGCEADTTTSIAHCLRCDNPCDYPNAVATCTAQGCAMGACLPGFYDLSATAPGCEYDCGLETPEATDLPDDSFMDANCDGVDGDASRAIFVRLGTNANNDGLTPANAVPSIGRALEIAAGRPERTQILVATGGYTGTTLTGRSGVGIYGGYSSDFWTRSTTAAIFTTNSPTALILSNITQPTVIDTVQFVVNAQSSSVAAVAVKIDAAGNFVTFRHSEISAGRGGPGTSAEAAVRSSNGGDATGASGASGGSAGGNGGGGATGTTRSAGAGGGAGSDNGNNCVANAPTHGEGGAGSGGSGLGCNDGDPLDGGSASAGCDGKAGGHGGAGDSLGQWSGLDWGVLNGTAGSSGEGGGGGGGGGAGGGEDCLVPCVPDFWNSCCFYCGTGRGGGGGGGGGVGGAGGGPGVGGGASVGLVVRNATVNLVDTLVVTVGGGNGGNGGAGGSGGSGGSGGTGATSGSNTEGDGGSGADGGDGGGGGCGGGGAGGPSIGVWGVGGTTNVVMDGTSTLTAGPGGNGGTSCGNAGLAGTMGSSRNVQIQQQ